MAHLGEGHSGDGGDFAACPFAGDAPGGGALLSAHEPLSPVQPVCQGLHFPPAGLSRADAPDAAVLRGAGGKRPASPGRGGACLFPAYFGPCGGAYPRGDWGN